MSALNSGQQERRELGSDLSKRQRMKLEMAMRRQDSLENQEIKHPKRRGHSSHHANEPTRRKEVKIDPYPSPAPLDQPYSSPINSSEPLSTTPPNHPALLKPLPHHLNPRYRLPEDDPNIFNYLLAYTYNEGEKRLEKECQDWSQLDDPRHAPLAATSSAASLALCQKINGRVREMKERLREPLGKTHRELNQRFLKKPSYSYLSLHLPATCRPTAATEVDNKQRQPIGLKRKKMKDWHEGVEYIKEARVCLLKKGFY